MTIRCEIVSQDRLVYEGDADMVILPGVNGEMGILPNHAPLLSTLEIGVIRVRLGNQEEVFTVTGGLVDVQPEIITVLADAAEGIDEIDVERAQAAKKRAQELLEKGPVKDEGDSLRSIEAALRRSDLRLEAVRRYRAGRDRIPPRQTSTSTESSEN
jgi:F-type H+-transporting ATPase subunit epsilon